MWERIKCKAKDFFDRFRARVSGTVTGAAGAAVSTYLFGWMEKLWKLIALLLIAILTWYLYRHGGEILHVVEETLDMIFSPLVIKLFVWTILGGVIAIIVGIVAHNKYARPITLCILIGACLAGVFYLIGIAPTPAKIVITLTLLYIIGSWVVIIDPPFVAVQTVLGEYFPPGVKARRGVFIVPGRGLFSDLIVYDEKFVERKIDVDSVITPDKVSSTVQVAYRFDPDPDNMHKYLLNGENDGAKESLERDIKTVIREWAKDADNEPKTYDRLIGMAKKATKTLIEGVVGSEVNDADIKSLKNGNGSQPLTNYGIVLRKLDVTKVVPPEKVTQAAAERAKEIIELQKDQIQAVARGMSVNKFIAVTGLKKGNLEHVKFGSKIVQAEEDKAENINFEIDSNASPVENAAALLLGKEKVKKINGGN